ncbi:MAG: hypothetical protein LBL48_06790 [Azoarcus sp.]|jgi:hypothetical protein|nr:hypothetical protein [Azoarcus sp.]
MNAALTILGQLEAAMRHLSRLASLPSGQTHYSQAKRRQRFEAMREDILALFDKQDVITTFDLARASNVFTRDEYQGAITAMVKSREVVKLYNTRPRRYMPNPLRMTGK